MFNRVPSIAVAALLTLATPAFAGPRAMGTSVPSDEALAAMAERHMGALFDKLHLSPDQKARMQEIRRRHLEATADPRKRLGEKRKALFALVRGVDAKKEQALALQHEIDVLQGQLSEARLAAWFEARSVLTHEQLQTLAKLPGGHARPHR